MMSALTDRHTQQITYDWKRGEPRGHVARGADDAPLGDCIDCAQCVTVCPTGIDIRNGSQLECVACTACMDACDTVMRKVSRPVGLIRTTSVHAIETGLHQRFPMRVRAYAAIWLLLLSALVTLLWIRPPVDILVLRQAGTLFVTLPDNQFGNFYTVQIVNRTGRAHTLEYRVVSPARATLTALGSIDTATPHGLVVGRFLMSVSGDDLTGPSTPIVIDVLADGRPLYTINSAFLGPGATQGAHQ
jgi:cytochrome c oxidase accessory protein FixG